MNDKKYPSSSTTWSGFWAHRNLTLIEKSPEDLFSQGNALRTLNDWNRLIDAKDKCSYYINGKQLSTLKNNTTFTDEDEFRAFIKEHLCKNQSAQQQEKLVTMILEFGYQSGLPHATNSAIAKMVAEKNSSLPDVNKKIVLGQAEMRININSTPEGIAIIEENQYKIWKDYNGNNKHTCSKPGEYFAKAETTYIMTPDEITLKDLIVDCPSRKLAPFFDERPDQILRFPILREFIARIIASLFKVSTFDTSPKPESKPLYQTPKDISSPGSSSQTN